MGLNLGLDAVADYLLEAELAGADGHGDHDFRMRVQAFLLEFRGGGEDGTILGFCDEREAHVQTDTAVTHHRVHLVQALTTLLHFCNADVKVCGQFFLLVLALRNKLVQRRVQKTEHNRLAVHHAEGFLHSGLHERFKLCQGSLALLVGVAENHLAELAQRLLAVAAIEHVLDTEQADTLGAELEGTGGIFRRIGIGADTQLAELVAHGHELGEERVLGGVHGFDSAFINQTLGTVQGEPIAFLEGLVDTAKLDGLVGKVNLEGVAAHDAALAPATGHKGGVGGHATALGEDTHGGVHAVDVFRRGFLADQDALFTGLLVGDGVLGGEDNLAYGTARGSGQTLCQNGGLLLGSGIQDGVQHLVQLGGSYAHHGGLFVDEAFLYHIYSHLQGGQTSALANTALQHPKFAFLDGEFNVLHILEVVLQGFADIVQLLVNLRHGGFQGRQVLVFLALGGLVQRVGSTDTGNHIFALGVDEPFTVELVVAVGRVAGERHTGSGGFTHVAEHHGLHVYSRAPIVRNMFNLTITDGALAVPALEHAADGAPELSLGIVREFYAQHFLDADFESLGKVFELLGGELGVALVAVGLLDLLHHAVQLLADALAVGRFNAFRLFHHNIGVHHNETAVCVIYKTRIAGLLDESGNGLGAKADIEDGIHHARHGRTGAGAATDKERVVFITEFLAHDLFRSFQCCSHIRFQFRSVTAAQPIVLGAAFGGDGETCGNGHAQKVHLCQVGAFATQQLSHLAIALGVLSAKAIDSFLNFCHKKYISLKYICA